MTLIFALTGILFGCLPDNRDHSSCVPKESELKQLGIARTTINGAKSIRNITYKLRQDDLALAEGDIALGTKAEIETKACGTTGALWTNNTFRYYVHPDFKNKERIAKAIARWQKQLGDLITFEEFVDEPTGNFVEFVNDDDGCWSYVGMIGGKQKIGLAKFCYTGAVTHEIGHALGLWHEQTRNDRDDFVEVKWCNIDEPERHNFFKVEDDGFDIGEYDYKSVMQYPRGAFSTNRRVTMESKTSKPVPWIAHRKVSDKDAYAIRCLYTPLDECR